MLNKQDLTLDEMMVFSSEMRASEKSTALAYLMLLGGHLGLHRFYLNKKGTGILQLVLFLLACVFYFGMGIGSAAESDVLIIISFILFAMPALVFFFSPACCGNTMPGSTGNFAGNSSVPSNESTGRRKPSGQ